MKITTRIVLQHFLSVLLQQLQNTKVHKLHPFFYNFFTKEDIVEMIKASYRSNANKHLRTENTSKEIFLELLSDTDVLLYYLEQWNTEIENNISTHPVEVMKTLEQLGHQTHYLASKATAFWDSYDFSNYRSLCKKAGKVTTIYGIYDASIKAANVEQETTHPKRFYETYNKATKAMEELVAMDTFTKEDVRILPRLVGDA